MKFFLIIYQITGSPFNGVDKIQINALLEPIPYLSGYSDVHSTILPLLWMQKSAKIDDKLSGELRLALYPIYAVYIIIYLLFFGGFSLLTIHITRWSYQSYKVCILFKIFQLFIFFVQKKKKKINDNLDSK